MISILLALLSAYTVLADKTIKTSALLPCQRSTLFSAQKFDILFDANKKKVAVDVAITSAIDGNFTVDVEAIIYGIKVITKTVSGCGLKVDGKDVETLCPISPGRFDVQTNITVPDNIIKMVPGIAYTFPNIDAVVRAKVYYADGSGKKIGNPIACVEAELSNGKTVQHSYVSWILFALIVFGVIVAGFATLWGHQNSAGHIISNVVSLFTYFQTTAVIAMMAVNRLPPIAAAWAQNFQWTMGIISVKFMQDAMTWYVRSTGGKVTNILPNKDKVSIAVQKRSADLLPLSTVHRLAKRVDLSSNVTTTNEHDQNLLEKTLVLQGIKRVSFLANIELSNFFITGATFFIFIGIAMVAILLLLKGVLEIFVRTKTGGAEKFEAYRINYRAYMKGMMFRYFLVGFTQLSLLCLWEFTSRESVATVVVACVMFAVLLISLSVAAAKVIILGQKSTALFNNPASILFGNTEILNRWGFLYAQFKATSYYFLIPLLLYNFAKSAVIALGQANGKVQSIIFVVLEVIYFVLLCWLRPFMDKKTNGFNIAISVFSIVNAIFFMFFSQLFGQKADVASSIIGVVYFVMNAVLSVAFLITIIVACALAIFHPDPDTRYQPVTDDRNLFMPEGPEKTATELDDLGYVARDGYRHSSYMNFEGQGAEQCVGAVRSEHPGPGPSSWNEHASHGPAADDDFQSYRDIQSRGILGQQDQAHVPDNDRLLR